MIKPGPFAAGISCTGIAFLLMLIVPNIIWTKRQPEGYAEYVKHENRILGWMENIGEVGSVFLLLAFKDFDPYIVSWKNGVMISFLNIYLVLIFALMVLYEIYWIRYFRSPRTMPDFYRGIAGIPLAGATIPVICLFLFAAYGRNPALASVAVIMGIGHIGIHYGHCKEAVKNTSAH
ncbi:MAG: hypothetical protein MJ137_07480 [Clostridia bacterium]|nr:hypothetical protein [Clostridia bacterium]